MDAKHEFKMFWDNEKDMLHVSCGSLEMSFSKEYLQDATAWQLVQIFDKMSYDYYMQSQQPWKSQYMSEPKHSGQVAPPPQSKLDKMAMFAKNYGMSAQAIMKLLSESEHQPKPKPAFSALLLPGIREHWHKMTGGWAETCTYYDTTQTFNIVFSQGVCAKFPRQLFEDQKYVFIHDILVRLYDVLKTYGPGGIGGFDYKGDDIIYTIELSWQIKTGQPETAQAVPKPTPIKELHVYDLGDGMLVPCELAHEIAAWVQQGKKPAAVWQSQYLDDPSKEDISEAAIKDLANAVDEMIMKKYSGDLYPGKVIMMDDKMTLDIEAGQFVITEEMMKDFDFIPSKHSTTQIAIPKKPKQITKQTLEHFHKILGGKKYPF